ncbi:sortilin isoform X1 [Clarias gariepinus]|uniref:sortilin isoform X1 n=2 Tax=Clarias gariepinus TaxID=13013 RepID=UPI00234C1C86|nr:sortilin isoform X1 [Clarias gariepinus]
MLYELNMRAVCWPVLLVSVALLCLDFAHALGRRESTALLRRQRRSGTSGLGDLSERKVKRSEGSVGDTPCLSLQGHGARLQQDTHTRVFYDVSGSVSLAWVGDGTGVLLVLTTYQAPLFMFRFSEPKLYRSEDYGKTFSDITNLLNNTLVMTYFGITIGPDSSGKIILTGYVSEGRGSRILRSLDFGRSFSPSDLPFQVLTQITYSPENNNVLAVISTVNDLWLSKDFGANWRRIHYTVCLAKWGTADTLFFTTNPNGSCSERGMLELRKTTDFGRSFKTIGSRIYSFGLGGRFLYASVMSATGSMRRIHVSVDQGEVWDMAQLPDVGHEQFYSILSPNHDMVFMHVDEPGDSGMGVIYVSDSRGIVFSKSLERHLYTSTGGETDFTVISSLRGVYMTSVLAHDGSVQTVITFNQGGNWRPLKKPRNAECDSTAKDPNVCSLHIHASYSTSMRLNVPTLPLSEPSAVGLILAHGSVGDAVSILSPDVYVSDDGGYTWTWALKGPHHYAILDSGGLLVAVEHNSIQPISQIKFSTDEGQCWHVYNFTDTPLYFTGLAAEPGARSLSLSLWGFRQPVFSQHLVSITIDFHQLLSRDCGEEDYVQWLAHSDNTSNPDDGCLLGYKEKYLRLRKGSVCRNGKDFVVTKQPTPCTCTLEDFQCDFGYYRAMNSLECVEQPELKGHSLEFCLHSRKEQLQTSGYRKIPGDRCEGGVQPKRKLIDLSKKCVSNLMSMELLSESLSGSVAPVVSVIILVLLACGVAGVLLVKKYVCGGRFLVHRYSEMQRHVEANVIEGVDDVDTTEPEKTHYNDDSDEDLLAEN